VSHGSGGLGAGPVITVVVLLILAFLAFRYWYEPDEGIECPEGAVRIHLEIEDRISEFCEMEALKHGPLRTWFPQSNRTLVEESYDRGRKCGVWKRYGTLGELRYESDHGPCSWHEE